MLITIGPHIPTQCIEPRNPNNNAGNNIIIVAKLRQFTIINKIETRVSYKFAVIKITILLRLIIRGVYE